MAATKRHLCSILFSMGCAPAKRNSGKRFHCGGIYSRIYFSMLPPISNIFFQFLSSALKRHLLKRLSHLTLSGCVYGWTRVEVGESDSAVRTHRMRGIKGGQCMRRHTQRRTQRTHTHTGRRTHTHTYTQRDTHRNTQGAPKGRQQKGETGPGTQIFADFC